MRSFLVIAFIVCWVSMVPGCTGIAVTPSCPEELEIGEAATLRANERNAGAIPTYKWEVSPADAGEFGAPDEPVTAFLAKEPGEATVHLTAADGLYQVTADCSIMVIETGDVTVSLSLEPDPPVVDESAMLVCRSIGETVTATRTIEQTGGTAVELTLAAEGVATFTPTETGDLSFTCVGESAGGRESAPSTITTTVVSDPNDPGNGNTNDNDDGRRPGRP